MAGAEGAKQSPKQGPAVTASPSTSTTSESKWKGRIVKRFKLVDELGEGAMGRVFVAEDTVLKRHVALKLLPSRFRDGRPNHRTERLIKEARSVASLEHPNTLSIFEIDQSGGVHYIAMELAEGGDLEHLVQLSGPMEIERACQLGAEAAEALAHAHTRGIVHRDVKPANLLLTRSGRCKVCDFGLALYEEATDSEGRLRCVGTPNFIAPEIAQGKGATPLSDIYSLGCTIFFLLSGRAPFGGANSREVMKQHISHPLPDLRKWRPDIPEKLAAAIEKACAKEPSQRYDSAQRFAKVLRTFTIPTASRSAGGMQPIGESERERDGGSRGAGGGGSHGAFSHASEVGPGLPPISAAQLAAILPAPSPESERHSALTAPLIWAGIGTVAAAMLIALGMWLSRNGPATSNASAQPPSPPAPAAHEPAAPDETVKARPAPPPAAAPETTAKPPAPAPGTIAGPDALLNGNMETADTDDGLAGWFIHERFKPQAQILTEGGSRFLRLTNDDPSRTVFADQTVKVDPSWKAVTVTARMRATNFKIGKVSSQDGRVAFAFHDASGTRVGNWPPVPRVQKDMPWIIRSVTADVPPGAKTIYLQLAIFNATGQVDFDDLSVVPQLAR